jgi:DNA-binding CsgD family transcriptional regulator
MLYDDISGTKLEALRQLVVQAQSDRGYPESCGELWGEVLEGWLRVHDCFSSGDRHYLTLRREPSQLAPIQGRSREVLERVLLDEGQKVTSIELGLSISSVACHSKRALYAIGMHSLPSKAPPLLHLLAWSHRYARKSCTVRFVRFELDGDCYISLSIPFPGPALACVLSPAEQAVVAMRLEGHSLAEIAGRRQTSTRTVANQLSAAFRRLGLSGRAGLVRYVAQVPEYPI